MIIWRANSHCRGKAKRVVQRSICEGLIGTEWEPEGSRGWFTQETKKIDHIAIKNHEQNAEVYYMGDGKSSQSITDWELGYG